MNKKISLSIITALSLATLNLNAQEFKPVGFKAMGMGGTGVASTRGSLSGYYNPALLRFSDYTAEFSIDAGIRVRESNLIDNMDALNDVDFQQTLDNIGDNAYLGSKEVNGAKVQGLDNEEIDIKNINLAVDTLNKIGANNAFQLSVTPSLTAQMSDALAIGVYANVDAAFRLNIDTKYLDLIFKDVGHDKDNGSIDGDSNNDYYSYKSSNDTYTVNTKSEYEASSLEYGVDHKKNYIQVDTMALVETPISYAKAYDWNSGTYSFGINLKPMALVTTSEQVALGESSDDADSNSDSYETTYKPTIGLDLGLAYRPKDSKMTIGLIGKNINTPTFAVDVSKTGITEDYKIDPSFRAGLSVPIWNDNIEFAFDVDLTKNDTLIQGEQSQYVGAGIALHPASWFALRVGAMQDIASKKFDDGTIATVGLGFGLKWFQLDVSAMVGTNTGEYDGQSIPRYAAVNVALISRWGDGYNAKKAPETMDMPEKTEQQNNGISTEDRERIQKDSNKAYDELDKS